MEAELGEQRGELHRSQRLLAKDEHTNPTRQAIFCSIVRHISSVQDALCSLHSTWAKKDALIVVESLSEDDGVELLANT